MKRLFFHCLLSVILAGVVLTGTTTFWCTKGIKASFNQETNSNINYQVFYLFDPREILNEDDSIKYHALAADKKIEIMIPENHIDIFRLDFGVKPISVTISDLKLIGDKTLEINDFDNFFYSPSVEEKIIENDKLTILSNQSDPYMTYQKALDLNERYFIDWQKVSFISLLSLLFGFTLLGILFPKKKKRKLRA